MEQIVTSMEIAEALSKAHNKVLRDVKALINSNTSYSKDIIWTEYKNSRGKYYPLAIISGELLKTFRLKYMYKVRMNSGKVKEPIALATIEQIKGVKLDRQYVVEKPCGKRFFIDGYDSINNIAYEIDEEYHAYQQKEDCEREQFIREHLGCEFVRIKI